MNHNMCQRKYNIQTLIKSSKAASHRHWKDTALEVMSRIITGIGLLFIGILAIPMITLFMIIAFISSVTSKAVQQINKNKRLFH